MSQDGAVEGNPQPGSGEFCHKTPESSHLTIPGIRNATRFGQLVV